MIPRRRSGEEGCPALRGQLARRGAALLGATLLVLAMAQLLAARRAAGVGERELVAAETALERADPGTAKRHLDRAESAFASVAASARSLLVRPLALVPVAGAPFRALGAIGRAGADAAGAGRSLAAAVGSLPVAGRVELHDGDLAPLRAGLVDAEDELDEAGRKLRSARRHLDGPAGATLPFLSGPADRATDRIDTALASLRRAHDVADLVVGLTASDADARLLVLSQDTLELRATGGFIGSFGVIRIAGGRVELERFDSYEALPDPQPPLEAPAAMRPWLPRPWGLSNVNWWPDFPTTAEAARQAFARQGGGPVDGVVAITENLLRDVVEVVGPIDLPGYPEPVVAEGLEERIVHEVELKRPADVPRKKFLIELADVVFDRLFDLGPGELPAISRALTGAASSGDVQVWFADPGRQEALAGTVAAGELPAVGNDFLMLVDTNRSAGKANKELVREVTYRVRRTNDGSHRGSLELRYRNQGEETVVNPWYFGHVRVYVPAGARLLAGTSDGVVDAGPADDGPYHVFVAEVFVEPQSAVTTRLEYALPPSVAPGGRYGLTWVRQAGTPRDRLVAMAGGGRWTGEPGDRTLEVSTDLRGHPVADFVRSRRVLRPFLDG